MTYEESLWGLIGLAREGMKIEAFIAFLREMSIKFLAMADLIGATLLDEDREPTLEELWTSWFPGVTVPEDVVDDEEK